MMRQRMWSLMPEARMSRAISEGLVNLDTVDMGPLLSLRAVVMKPVRDQNFSMVRIVQPCASL